MRIATAAAIALAAASSLDAQDLGTATPIAGNWAYAPTPDGSEASFADSASNPQLWVHCLRATRHVTIAKRASVAAPFLNLWSSSASRSIPSAFNPATGRLTIELGAYDPLLDAMAGSRGRIGFSIAGQPPLVVPPWAEVARVIEDCRV